jgi:hypothetical protein
MLRSGRDRTVPIGYKVSRTDFANGEPIAAANSKTSSTDIFANADNSVCPKNCFRPVGIAFDEQGRMFVSSDATGEIYVVVKEQSATGANPASSSSAKNADGKLAIGLAGNLVFFICLLTIFNNSIFFDLGVDF